MLSLYEMKWWNTIWLEWMKARVFTTNKLIYSRVSGHLPINILPLLEILVLGVWVWHVVVFVLLAPPTADVASREASTQGCQGSCSHSEGQGLYGVGGRRRVRCKNFRTWRNDVMFGRIFFKNSVKWVTNTHYTYFIGQKPWLGKIWSVRYLSLITFRSPTSAEWISVPQRLLCHY